MSVTNPNSRKDYVAAGGTTFAYDFKIFVASDLSVYVDSVLKTLTTDYTVTGAGNPSGGNVVFNVAPTGGAKIAILNVQPLTQGTTFVDNGPLPASSMNDGLDKLTMIAIQIKETFGRALKFSLTSTFKDVDIPDLLAAKYLRVNTGGTGLEWIDLTTSGVYANPITTLGDLLRGGSGGVAERLPYSVDGAVLIGSGGKPNWSDSYVGPYAFGAAPTAGMQWRLGGTFAGGRGLIWNGLLNSPVNQTGYGVSVEGTVAEASSGTHGELSGFVVSVSFNSAAAATTRATQASFYGSAAPSGTVSAATLYIGSIMTGATNNYGLWNKATSRFDDLLLGFEAGKNLHLCIGASGGTITFRNSGVGELGRVTDAGVLAFGHATVTDSHAGDILAGGTVNHGGCRLEYVSGTQIQLKSYRGNKLMVQTGGAWTVRVLPDNIASGNPTTASNFVNGTASQTLSASTDYLVCVFDNAGTLAFDFRTTLTTQYDGATGVQVRTGDATRTVVGLIRTNATPNFVDFWTLSWFNRSRKTQLSTFSADRTTTSGTYVEPNTEIRNTFITWPDEPVFFAVDGTTLNSATDETSSAIGIDGTTAEAGFETGSGPGSAAVGSPVAIAGWKAGLAAGNHYATLLGKTNAGTTGTWHSATAGRTAKVYIHATVRG